MFFFSVSQKVPSESDLVHVEKVYKYFLSLLLLFCFCYGALPFFYSFFFHNSLKKISIYISLHSEDDSKRLPLRCTFLIEFIIIKKVFFPSLQSGIGIEIEPTVFFFEFI